MKIEIDAFLFSEKEPDNCSELIVFDVGFTMAAYYEDGQLFDIEGQVPLTETFTYWAYFPVIKEAN